MNLTLYVPKDLERELGERARRAGLTPSLWVQGVVRDALSRKESRFSEGFLALAGSWEDGRDTKEIVADLRRTRVPSRRKPLR